MTIEAMRFAAAGKIIDDQKGLIDRLYSERDEARKLAELWRDYAMLDFEWCICNAKDESPRFDELLKKWNTGRDWELLPWEEKSELQ
jgi:hypothetical protein